MGLQVLVLAGGKGTRLGGSSSEYPKALARIGDKPILWHLLSHFDHHGFREFTIALGDRGESVKQYFAAMHLDHTAVHVNTRQGTGQPIAPLRPADSVTLGPSGHDQASPDWAVNLIDTGLSTRTGGRIRRAFSYLKREPFIMTWCDALSDLDPNLLTSYHQSQGCSVTMVTVDRPARFGHVEVEGDRVKAFEEKPAGGEGRISAGCFVVQPEVIDRIDGDEADWDYDILPRLARENDLAAFHHQGSWQCMDTVDEQQTLNDLWSTRAHAWKASLASPTRD